MKNKNDCAPILSPRDKRLWSPVSSKPSGISSLQYSVFQTLYNPAVHACTYPPGRRQRAPSFLSLESPLHNDQLPGCDCSLITTTGRRNRASSLLYFTIHSTLQWLPCIEHSHSASPRGRQTAAAFLSFAGPQLETCHPIMLQLKV